MKKEKKLLFKKLNSFAKAPTKEYASDAGYDLYSSSNKKIRIPGHNKVIVNTGLVLIIPEGYRIEIKERSGLSSNSPIRVCGGIIDQNYLGEVRVILENTSPYFYEVEPFQKIAQAVIYENILLELEETDTTPQIKDTDRGEKGFGSSDSN